MTDGLSERVERNDVSCLFFEVPALWSAHTDQQGREFNTRRIVNEFSIGFHHGARVYLNTVSSIRDPATVVLIDGCGNVKQAVNSMLVLAPWLPVCSGDFPSIYS